LRSAGHSIKYCKGIEYSEWVVSLVSERVSIKAGSPGGAKVSKSVARLAEIRGEVATVQQSG
jgi:hypothetical protein